MGLRRVKIKTSVVKFLAIARHPNRCLRRGCEPNNLRVMPQPDPEGADTTQKIKQTYRLTEAVKWVQTP